MFEERRATVRMSGEASNQQWTSVEGADVWKERWEPSHSMEGLALRVW